MNIDVDLVGICQVDSLRHQLNNEFRERFSRFRIVLVADQSELAKIDKEAQASTSVMVDQG